MGLNYAVWEREALPPDQAAPSSLEALRAKHRADSPTPAVRSFVERLLRSWPCRMTEGGENSPWGDGPVMGNATGPVFYFSVLAEHPAAADLLMEAADQAASRGLVVFDVQAGEVVPPPAL